MCRPGKRQQIRGLWLTMLLDCRIRQQQGAENLRLSPPRVVRMEMDHGGLMWSCCHIGKHGNSRSLFRQAAFMQGMRLVLVTALSWPDATPLTHCRATISHATAEVIVTGFAFR